MTTMEEAVETIRAHFTREGAQMGWLSATELSGWESVAGAFVPSCLYRNPDDPERKCAVGVLLTDEEHDAMLVEQQRRSGVTPDTHPVLTASVSSLASLTSFPDRLRGIVDPLREIQTIHDDSQNVETFLTRLNGKYPEVSA